MNICRILIVPLTAAVFLSPVSAQDFDIDREISRIRKELAEVSSQRQTIRDEKAREKREFTEYQKRTQKRFESIREEIDSLKALEERFSNKNDSLSALISSSEARMRQYDLMQDHFRRTLIKGLDRFRKTASELPPMISEDNVSSISFLKSESTSRTVDNIEAIQRLTQILKDMEEASSGIQIVQGPSPLSDMRGVTYRLRIGSFFEAVVNASGTKYALWDGYDKNGKEKWKISEDETMASNILEAVNIREGKALPDFVQIPISAEQ
ncbi:MAG: DUF3450 family protein [Chitinispirillaceae bacterium]